MGLSVLVAVAAVWATAQCRPPYAAGEGPKDVKKAFALCGQLGCAVLGCGLDKLCRKGEIGCFVFMDEADGIARRRDRGPDKVRCNNTFRPKVLAA